MLAAMRPRFDHALILVGTLVFAWAWMAAADRTKAEAGGGDRERGPAVLAPNDGNRDARERLGLPEGVSIDPTTGLLVGVALQGDANTTAVTWELLKSYEYEPGLENVPADVKALDGKQVVMLGFQLASYEYDDIREFYLVASHWSCCYGVPAGINGAVHVAIKDGGDSLALTNRPLKVVGTMRVREMKDGGIVMAIYALEDAKATEMDW